MTEAAVALRRGMVVWAAPDPAAGREQSGRRPVLVVSSQLYLQAVSELVLTIPVTTRDRGWPNHVRLRGDLSLGQDCFAMTEQVRATSRSRLGKVVGAVDGATMSAIDGWLRDFLALPARAG
ncbi:type II toxin-antitoxin system PemK/MazF family toxin [Nocardioides sp.]|uniref:type II toxin-antitoxin system PemK/MazF family toxin n=1 Tax=Nocardioides sp. TaxID=35761 RepID=UPI0039E4FB7D